MNCFHPARVKAPVKWQGCPNPPAASDFSSLQSVLDQAKGIKRKKSPFCAFFCLRPPGDAIGKVGNGIVRKKDYRSPFSRPYGIPFSIAHGRLTFFSLPAPFFQTHAPREKDPGRVPVSCAGEKTASGDPLPHEIHSGPNPG